MLIRFPPRRICAVIVVRERNGGGWLVLARGHGWLHGSLKSARREACQLSDNLNLPIVECLP
jgi:hypothetical protein